MVHFLTRLFFENGFVKLLAVAVIFYFALYKHDESPDSVAKRFNKEELSKDFKDVRSQTKKIFDALAYKKAMTPDKVRVQTQSGESSSTKRRKVILAEQVVQIDALDEEVLTKVESGTKGVACGDFVTFSYDIFDNENKDVLFSKKGRSLTIAQQENVFFERLLVGLKNEEEKRVFVDKDYNFLPAIVRKYFLSSEGKGIFVKLKLEGLSGPEVEASKVFGEIEKIICN